MTNNAIRLSWSHYRTLLQVSDDNARLWYENESVKQTWSVGTLQRNISSQYYFRLLQSPSKEKEDYQKNRNYWKYLKAKLRKESPELVCGARQGISQCKGKQVPGVVHI